MPTKSFGSYTVGVDATLFGSWYSTAKEWRLQVTLKSPSTAEFIGFDGVRGSKYADKLSVASSSFGTPEVSWSGTIFAGAGNDTLFSHSSGHRLYGESGHDTFFEIAGGNTLYGGTGNDRYILSALSTIVELPGEGVDTIELDRDFLGSSVNIPENVENFRFFFSNIAIAVHGNELDNYFEDNDASNQFWGKGGADTFEDGAGSDFYRGGSSIDTNGRQHIDTVRYFGSRGEYALTDDASGKTFVRNLISGDVDVLSGIEIIEFRKLGGAVKPDVGPVTYLDLANFALGAYGGKIAIDGDWYRPVALEFDLVRSSTAYSFKKGVYVAGNASASLYAGSSNGKNTLVVAFKGSDFPLSPSGFLDAKEWSLSGINSHYEKFRPLVDAIKAHASLYSQILVTGHSLGGAMVQKFLLEVRDAKVHGVTFGSVGTSLSGSGAEGRLLHFMHDGDIAQNLSNGKARGHLGQEFWIPINNLLSDRDDGNLSISDHSMKTYLASLGKLAKADPSVLLPVPNFTSKIDNSNGASVGTEKADLIGTNSSAIGPAANESIYGFEGDDVLFAYDGNDALYGGDGDDILVGGSGYDLLSGGAGSDTAAYDYRVIGGESYLTRDSKGVVADLQDPWQNRGEAFGDRYESIENLIGTKKGDYLYGDNKANVLNGGGGSDRLCGRDGDDTLIGGSSRDYLHGGKGKDTLQGGTGTDHFIYTQFSDSTLSLSGRDTILDFTRADDDRIDLQKIDANSTLAGKQAFKFVGTKSFSKTAGELRYAANSSGTTIYADVDGDGKSDFAIDLDTSVSLRATDFIL